MSVPLPVNVYEDVTITEDIAVLSSTYEDFDESITVSEDIVMFIPELFISVSDADITLTEYVAETRVV